MITVIPAIDIIDGKCVRLTRGDYDRQTTYDASPAEMVRRYVDAGLGYIHAVDLTGARLGRPDALRSLEAMASVDGARIEWGGGLKTMADMRDAFNAGASVAVAGSVAVKAPDLFAEWLRTYGGARITLGADLREGRVSVSGWTRDEDITALQLAERFIPDGLSRLIVTDIACDGMLQGPSFSLYTSLIASLPEGMVVCASGGISGLADIERLEADGVPEVIVGKAIYEGCITLKELERYGK